MSDVYELRLLLEPPAAAAAAGRLDAATLAGLRTPLAATVDVGDAASIDRFLDSNRAVHVTVARAAGNGRLAAIVERLLDDMDRARRRALRERGGSGEAARGRRGGRGAADARRRIERFRDDRGWALACDRRRRELVRRRAGPSAAGRRSPRCSACGASGG